MEPYQSTSKDLPVSGNAAKKKNKVFFPNLDGLRFVCFLTVFLYHCNETIFRKISNPYIRKTFNFLFQNGNIGVNIFFVLSGFLITYLLIKEKEIKNDINLKNFYIRRILRIWPLFYLCVFLGFVVFPWLKYRTIPSLQELSNPWFYIFFAGNFDFIRIWPKVPDALNLIVLWSVAVEEQFYITWPIILKLITRKLRPWIFSAIIIFTLIFRSFYTEHNTDNYAMLYFHTFSVIGDMALGGLMAYMCSFNNNFFLFIRTMKRWQIIFIYATTISLVLFKKEIFYYPLPLILERLIFSILFSLIIAEQNFSENSFFKFSSFKLITKLGIYTYGLYCLHFIGILITEKLFEKLNIPVKDIFTNALAVFAALIITIVLSLFSYHAFEKWFLKLKNQFSIIIKQ